MRDEVARVRGSERVRVGIVGPPGAVAAMSTPDAEPGYLRAVRARRELGKRRAPPAWRCACRCSARSATRRDVRCPMLLLVALDDAIAAPGAPSRRPTAPAQRGPPLHAGHFDVYVGTLFELAVAEQVEFLRRHLLDGRPAPAAAAEASPQAALR